MTSTAHDEASRFIFSLAGPNRNYLIKEDFTSMLQDLIDSFPGLHFLREAQEFHSRYVETVLFDLRCLEMSEDPFLLSHLHK